MIIVGQERSVTPGFIDAHTHLIFAGERSGEFYARLQGATYLEIQRQGGGIHATVQALHQSSKEQLIRQGLFFLRQALRQGTTTMEVKTGYGLDFFQEEKILQVIAELNRIQPVELIPTFLGAHVYPKTKSKDEYFHELIKEMLPAFRKYCQRCDIFIEENAYSVEDARIIFKTAHELGYHLCAHANQLHDIGAVELALEFQLDSLDHLELIAEDKISRLAQSDICALFLPVAELVLGHEYPAPWRQFLDSGGIAALATDFNPGSAPCLSIPLMLHLAALRYHCSFAELLNSVTIQAAYALRCHERIGCIAPGYQADLIIWRNPSPEMVPYLMGVNLAEYVMKNGKIYAIDDKI